MPFIVYVASDILGQKHNIELEFPYAPSLPDLTAAAENAFSAEQQFRRPGMPPFQVAKFQVVDDITDDWVEVIGSHQLRNQCQVYAFQPHSTRYTESQGHIPPAVKPRTGYGAGARAVGTSYTGQSPAMYSAPSPGSRPAGYNTPGSAGGYPYGKAPSVPASPSMPDNASHDDKVRIVFEQADANKNRVMELDELKRIMQICHIDFSALTIEDLFRKGDVDRDGVINFPEWQRFAELYPTMLDSLYYRLKAHWEQMASEAQVDAARAMRPSLEENERNAKHAFDQSQIDADEAARRLADADRAAADAAARQRAAEDAARDGMRDVDRAKQNKADRERDLAAERERERQGQIRAQDSARELDAAQRRLAAAQQGLADADAAERRAAQALADAQRERERQQGLVDQAAADAARAQDRHNQVLGDIPRGIEEAQARLAQAEQDLAAADARQRELAARAGDAAAAAADAARNRDELGRMLQGIRDRQEPARLAWLDAQRALEDHDRQIAELEAALAADREQRRALDEQEKALVEQEVRLREQRENLEEKEGALRDAHTSFFQAAGRPSPNRSRSPIAANRNPGGSGSPYTARGYY